MGKKTMVRLRKWPGYMVTRDGKVYSCKTKRFLKEKPSLKAYPRVILYREGQPKSCWIHRLVCAAFNGLRAGQDVHHIDGDKQNCHASNLKALSPKEHQRIHKKGLVKRKYLTKEEAGTPF